MTACHIAVTLTAVYRTIRGQMTSVLMGSGKQESVMSRCELVGKVK